MAETTKLTSSSQVSKFYGREVELARLNDAFERLQRKFQGESEQPLQQNDASSSDKELMLITGAPGIGKSRLVQEFREQVLDMPHQSQPSNNKGKNQRSNVMPKQSGRKSLTQAFFVSGKASEPLSVKSTATSLSSSVADYSVGTTTSGRPFACLVDACAELCQQITRLCGDQELLVVRANILAGLGGSSGVQSLSRLIPVLAPLMEIDSKPKRDNEHTIDVTLQKVRLEFLLKGFVSAICNSHPVVLVLDDIQWADNATLNLISTMIVDPGLNGVMIVGLHRNTDAEEQFATKIIEIWVTPFLERHQQKEDGDKEEQPVESRILSLRGLASDEVRHLVRDTFIPADAKAPTPSRMEQMQRLTAKLLQQTNGDCFYLCETVQALKRSSLIKYESDNDSLQWESSKVNKFFRQLHSDVTVSTKDNDESGHLTTDLNTLILTKLQAQSDRLQTCLAVASILRCPFVPHDLAVLLPALDPTRLNDIELDGDLEFAVTEGLLENNIGSPTFRFAHDRVQEAAHALLMMKLSAKNAEGQAEAKYQQLCWIVGSYLVLQKQLDQPSQSSSASSSSLPAVSEIGDNIMSENSSFEFDLQRFFVGVNHLNSVPLDLPLQAVCASQEIEFLNDDYGDRAGMLIKINFKAGEMASQQAAFVPALQYFEVAIQLLEMQPEKEAWEKQYEVCYQIYSKAARICISLGKIEKGETWIRYVLPHAKTQEAKIEAYMILARGLGAANRHFESFRVGREALMMVKEFPRFINTINLIRQLTKLKKLLDKVTDDEIMLFPTLDDVPRRRILELMTFTATKAYNCEEGATGVMCLFRQLFVLLKKRIMYPAAAEAFTYLGVLCYGPFNDLVLGKRASKLSTRLLSKMEQETRSLRTRTMATNLIFIQAWDKPLMQTLEVSKAGYKMGMEDGDLEYGMYHMLIHYMLLFSTGEELSRLLQAVDGFYLLSKQYNSDSTLMFIGPIRKMAMDLSGATRGELFSWYYEKESEQTETQMKETLSLAWFYMCRAIPAFILGEIEMAEAARAKVDGVKSVDLNFATLSNLVFFSSLICSAMYRRTGKRKYLKKVKHQIKTLKSFMDYRGLKILHRYILMEADYMTCTKGTKDASKMKENFDKAIVACTRSAFTHDAALANELAGEYFLSLASKGGAPGSERLTYLGWTKRYLSTSYGLYATWGAKPKLARMEALRSDHIDFRGELARRGTKLSRDTQNSFLSEISSLHGSISFSDNASRAMSAITADEFTVRTGDHTMSTKSGVFSSSGDHSSRSEDPFQDGGKSSFLKRSLLEEEITFEERSSEAMAPEE